jgi:small subunit ribosomal protein S20
MLRRPKSSEVSVAHHKSARKRARQSIERKQRNLHVKSRVRTLVKQFRAATAAGDDSAREKLRIAESAIRKAASKGVIPKRRASRAVGRLAKNLGSASR